MLEVELPTGEEGALIYAHARMHAARIHPSHTARSLLTHTRCTHACAHTGSVLTLPGLTMAEGGVGIRQALADVRGTDTTGLVEGIIHLASMTDRRWHMRWTGP